MRLLPKLSDESRLKILPYLVGVVIVGVIALKFVPNLFVPAPPPLVESTQGLVMAENIDELSKVAGRAVVRPTIPEGVWIAALGAYTEATPAFPKQTTVIVLARGAWRFAEIIERPGANIDEVTASYGPVSSRKVTLAAGTQAKWIMLDQAAPICLDGRDGQPGTCVINRIIVFQNETGVVSIATDSRGATDGELLALARSLASP